MKKILFPILIINFLTIAACNAPIDKKAMLGKETISFSTQEVISKANEYLEQKPVTITSFKAERSVGGIHDYFSEGSYWWPNPNDLKGPYIRKDGQRNPNNFKKHKTAIREFSIIVTTLTAAYHLTKKEKYALHAIEHINAWFVDVDTRMNPSLLYAQAIKGISTGRGIGIIDTIRLINVALSVELLERKKMLKGESLTGVKKWFNDYANWLTTHPYGIDERDNNNNHSTWWGAQVAAFATVAERSDIFALAQLQYKKQIDIQMAEDGSFPDELSRTKPFHYMNYNLRAWTTFALLASTSSENLWQYKNKKGTLKSAIEFAIPFYENKNKWKYHTEIEKEITLQSNDFLLFAHWGLEEEKYLKLWSTLEKYQNKYEAVDANLILWQNKILR